MGVDQFQHTSFVVCNQGATIAALSYKLVEAEHRARLAEERAEKAECVLLKLLKWRKDESKTASSGARRWWFRRKTRRSFTLNWYAAFISWATRVKTYLFVGAS